MKTKITAVLIMILLSLSGSLRAQESIPVPGGFVNDYAGILSNQEKGRLESLFFELEKKTTAQAAVVILKTTGSFDIETYAVKLFEQWGLGQKGKDNGILLLFALEDRQMRIEVGYGLEGAVPDALAKKIIADIILPLFKEGKYAQGIMNGGLAIAKLTAKEYEVELAGFNDFSSIKLPKLASPMENFLRLFGTFIFFLLLFGLRSGFFWWMILAPGTNRRRGGYWYGSGYGGQSGGFGGGFGGFGGGMSGGGGAGGRW